MNEAGRYTSRPWRKSRLAARLLLRKAAGRLTERDRRIARLLSQDEEVTDRLIQQGLYYLGVGQHKNELDRSLDLVER
jgi:hypothetical protein